MPTADQVLDVARSQIGTVEDASGHTPYGQWYGMDRVAWCAIFQQWVFAQAGGSALIPRTAYTPTFYQWFKAKGQAGAQPRLGSLVFYDWPGDGVNRIQHVGIVEALGSDGTLVTIEGNTTPPAGSGDQSHGGGVWRRRRTQGAVVGYAYPAYDPPTDSTTLPRLYAGMPPNDSVRHLKAWLNAYPWKPELPLLTTTDGTYGAKTSAVLRAAQAQMGIVGPDADGSVCGPRTNAALWARGYRG